MPTTSVYLGQAEEITIEGGEDGFCLWLSTEEGTFRVNIQPAALDLYEAVQRVIGPWYAEGESVRRSFERDLDRAQAIEREYAARRVFACDPDESAGYALDDPKHPQFHSVHADIWDAREGK